jgi:predicted  nucleic acid-binding Zn-ribbon protein
VVLFSKLHKNRPEAIVVSEVFNSDTLQALNQRIDSSKVKAIMLEKDTITLTKQHKFLMEEVPEIEKELEKLEEQIEEEKRDIKRRKRNAE